MNECLAFEFLERLFVASMFLAFSAVAVSGMLRVLRCQSSRLNAWAWIVVLLQGILVFQLPIQIPWRSSSANEVTAIAHDESQLVSRRAQNESPADEQINAADFGTAPVSSIDMPPQGIHAIEVATKATPVWPQVLFSLWIGGVCFLLFRRFITYLKLVRVSNFEECDIDEWQNGKRYLLSQIRKTSRFVLVAISDQHCAPCPAGVASLCPSNSGKSYLALKEPPS